MPQPFAIDCVFQGTDKATFKYLSIHMFKIPDLRFFSIVHFFIVF